MVATILFYVFAGLAILGAVMVITHRNPIYSALSLILTLFALAGIYVLPFEVTSVLLIVAMAGAVYLAKRRLNTVKE